MRALVTGSNGFIGSHMVEVLLAEGHTPVAMLRETSNTRHLAGLDVEKRFAGLSDVDAMAAAMQGTDVVLHFAGATTGSDAAFMNSVNGGGTANVMAAAKKAKDGPRRVVYVSSLAGAGPSHPGVPRGEHHRPTPVSDYGRSKHAGELAAFEAARDGAIEVVIVRPPVVYGPRDEDFLQVIKMAKGRLVLELGFHDAAYSIVHPADLCRGTLLAAERGQALPTSGEGHALGDGGKPVNEAGEPTDPAGQGVYFLTDGGRYGWAQLGQLTASALGRRALTLKIPVPIAMIAAAVSEGIGRLRGQTPIFNRDKVNEGAQTGWWASSLRAEQQLGYRPAMPFELGIEQTIRWLRERGQI